MYTPQELTEDQKAQARINIGITGNGFVWRGEYDELTDYHKNDVVQQNGSCYVAIADMDDGAPTGSPVDNIGTLWDLVASAGATPEKGTDYFTDEDIKEIVSAVIDALPVYTGEVV